MSKSNKKDDEASFWSKIGPVMSILDDLKNCELEQEEAEDICRLLELEWFHTIPHKQMQKIMWYIVVHTDYVKEFIDGYDKSGPAPLFMEKIDELLQEQKQKGNPSKK